MRIAVIGTGYVGLVTGTCFADNGNEVACVDNNEAKIEGLLQGRIPIYEPGLAELVARNTAAGRLHFTTALAESVQNAAVIYIAVGTPQQPSGAADLNALWQVVDAIAPHLNPTAVVAIKSTVPVGTNQAVYQRLQQLTQRDVDVVSNPEFLKEGAAINDFMYPDRVVVGVRRAEAADVLRELYAPLLRTERPLLTMSPESAELTKYAANSLLATKISFINEMANLCERMGGDINDVRRGIGHDHRIGFSFLFPGVGYGGSCFPKDLRALANMSRDHGVEPRILQAVEAVNQHQKLVLLDKIRAHYGERLSQMTLAVWGLAFKPRTDDIREAPAIALIDELLNLGVKLQVHDPEAMNNVRVLYGDRLTYAAQQLDALQGAQGLIINTEWGEFRNMDFDSLRERMSETTIFDGRNLFELEQIPTAGFTYYSIGRPVVTPRES
ncbi:MAG: UDP-glucose dehydrogenase family protein [Planctomycetota bacterium]